MARRSPVQYTAEAYAGIPSQSQYRAPAVNTELKEHELKSFKTSLSHGAEAGVAGGDLNESKRDYDSVWAYNFACDRRRGAVVKQLHKIACTYV